MGLKRTSDGKAINSVDEAVEEIPEISIVLETIDFDVEDYLIVNESTIDEIEIEIVVDEDGTTIVDAHTDDEDPIITEEKAFEDSEAILLKSTELVDEGGVPDIEDDETDDDQSNDPIDE